MIKEFRCRLSWADTRDITTILLQIVSNLYRLEHHRDPEVGKYQYEKAEDDIVSELPLADRIGEVVEETHTCGTAEVSKDLRGEHKNCATEDDGHDTCVIHLERKERALATVNLTANDTFSILDRDLTLGLSDRYKRSSHSKK